jgi:glycosyltransferase involved in cell wall biosynthesis
VPALRVGITAEPLFQRVPTGAAIYTLALCRGFVTIGEHEGVTLFHAEHALVPAEVEQLPMRRCSFGLDRDDLYRAWAETRRPTPQSVCGPLEIVHATGPTVPPAGGAALVATVHDLAPLRFPERYPRSTRLSLRRGMQLAAREADRIICPSASTAAEVEELLGVEPNRLRVVPHGVDIPPAEPEWARQFVERRGISEPYVLWVGTQEQRKNVAAVLDAFALVATRNGAATLVLHGPAGWLGEEVAETIRRRGLESRVRISEGSLTREELAALYARARVFVYPSLYEGFGLPVLEAMASGAPVVASNRSAIPESAGSAAVLLDPTDPDALAEAIERVLGDAHEHDDLADRGRERARGFTWDRAARQTWSVYEELA